jgi:antitoxin (DNA-binding transcriptional repressor) of toxin-antitoxin stability system
MVGYCGWESSRTGLKVPESPAGGNDYLQPQEWQRRPSRCRPTLLILAAKKGYNARMSTVSLQDFLQNPVALLDRVEAGERLVVSRAGHPIAELRPFPSAAREPRPFGLAAGEFAVPDDFDAPLPDDLLRGFEGRSSQPQRRRPQR